MTNNQNKVENKCEHPMVESNMCAEFCRVCGEVLKETIPKSTTLGTTMEIKNIIKKYNDKLFPYGGDSTDMDWEAFVEIIAQSKTDLLNALIEREKCNKRDLSKQGYPTDRKDNQDIGYNQAKTDTINHLKSLRDE